MVSDLVENFGIPREKLVRIYNPVDTEKVREIAETGSNPFNGTGPHLVAAGRICRQKGFDLLIDAMPAVLQRFPDAQLLILGEGPLEAELKEQARNLGLQEKSYLSWFSGQSMALFETRRCIHTAFAL